MIHLKWYLFKNIYFCLYYDRTDQNWQEVKWEKDKGGGIGPRVGIQTQDTRRTTVLYFSVLPTRLSVPLKSYLIH